MVPAILTGPSDLSIPQPHPPTLPCSLMIFTLQGPNQSYFSWQPCCLLVSARIISEGSPSFFLVERSHVQRPFLSFSVYSPSSLAPQMVFIPQLPRATVLGAPPASFPTNTPTRASVSRNNALITSLFCSNSDTQAPLLYMSPDHKRVIFNFFILK